MPVLLALALAAPALAHDTYAGENTIHGVLGARLHLNPRVALLFRVSTPTGLQFGVVF